jgi:hypothetical protein
MAWDRETGRRVLAEPIVIQPGEEAPISLPYGGFTVQEYILKTIDGSIEYERRDINRTNRPITIYKVEWYDSGLPAGFCWHKHLRFE